MALQRMTDDRRSVAIRGSPAREPDGAAFGARGGATARVLRGGAACAGMSVGYGVWQKALTRRLLLSLPPFGISFGIRFTRAETQATGHYNPDAREGPQVTPPAASSHAIETAKLRPGVLSRP